MSDLSKYCVGFIVGAVIFITTSFLVGNTHDSNLVEKACKEHNGVLVKKTQTTVVCNDFTTWEYQEGYLKKK